MQDLTKDVVRIDVIPQQSLDTIRVSLHLGILCSMMASFYAFCFAISVWIGIIGKVGSLFRHHLRLHDIPAIACRAGLADIDEHQVLREQDEPQLEAHPEEHHRSAHSCSFKTD